jgi:large subunit ribosomal protein L25
MEQLTLAVESRANLGKGASRQIRRAGQLPGVLYGLGKNTSVTLDPRKLMALLLSEGGRNKIINLQGGGYDGKHALVKDYQVDPVSRVLLHVDLIEIDIQKKINATVALNFTGKALGVADGGVLNIVERSIQVRCLPTQIPQHIDVDVTALKIGDSIHYDQISLPEGVERPTGTYNPTLVTVVPPTKEEELAPSLAPTAEPEVITEKKPAEGEAAAGAAPAAEAKKEEKKK